MSTAMAVGVFGGPSADDGYSGGSAAAARRREELREFGSRLSDHQELRGCGRKIRKGKVGSATEILEVTTSCRRKWLCPTCGYTAWRRQAAQLKRRLLRWTAQGGAVALLTLTQSHGLNDGLAPLWDRMEDVVLAQLPDAALYKFVLGALHQWARNEAFEHRSRGRYHRSTANHTPEHRRTPRPVAEWTGEGVPALR